MWLALGAVAWAGSCPEYGAAVVALDLGSDGPTEASGLASSRSRPGVYYTHDDGGEPELHAFDLEAGWIETHPVSGVDLVDWEDIAAGPCPDGGHCLFLGDIGDNDASRTWISVYVVAEPPPGGIVDVLDQWRAQWPDGPRDAETLLVHPGTGRVSLVSKDSTGVSAIGRLPEDPGAGIATLEVVATVALLGDDEGDRLVTGGAWDAEGERLVLRARERLLEWETDPCDPHGHWVHSPQSWSTPALPRAEGVDFGSDGGLVLVAEGAPTDVGTLACPDLEAGTGDCAEEQDCGCGRGGSAWVLLPLWGAGRVSRRRGPPRRR